MTALVFFPFFCLYLWTLPPALAPYRDAGEMTVSAWTLGVSHPTGYPLYILFGRIFQALPLANPAYRMGLLSVLAAALALAALHRLCARRWGLLPAWGAALLLGLNSTYWSVALVSEMYSLWILGAVLLLGLALERTKYWFGFAALYGLLLGNRLDLLLWAPGLLWLVLAREDLMRRQVGAWAGLAFLGFPFVMTAMGSNFPILALILGTVLWLYRGSRSEWLWSAGLALAGLSVYLYLPLRSASGPWLDWNHPAELSNFAQTLLRTKYGGTLDLLSKNYAAGELFGASLKVYAGHLLKNFSWLGLAAALAGSLALARRDPREWLGTACAYWWSGPVFLFMANMPPNPHALAIVEPHYLLSDLILAFWSARGLALLSGLRLGAVVCAVAVVVLSAWPLANGRLAEASRREHLFSYDYAKNMFRSTPPGAVLVAKKDVQLYTLWHYQTAQGWRPDLRLVAQGLAGAAWYQAGWRRRGSDLALMPLRDAGDWRRFAGLNGPAYATMDVEGVPDSETGVRGLTAVLPSSASELALSRGLWEMDVRRGDYSYENQPDFFTSDVIDGYARARYQLGSRLFEAGEMDAAVSCMHWAWSLNGMMAEPAMFLGYVEFKRGEWKEARRYYDLAVGLYGKALGLAERYRSLKGVKDRFRVSAAEAHVHRGVAAEKSGDPAGAERDYRRAIALHPSAQAHYNLAVLYWNKDWAKAEDELSEALRLDPGHAEAAKHLARLRAKK